MKLEVVCAIQRFRFGGITDFEIEDFPKIKNPFDALSGLFEVKFLNNLQKSHSATPDPQAYRLY